MALLDQYTSAAKDGVIDVLTAKASKLGVSLERAVLVKKEVEDRADKLQVRYCTTCSLSDRSNPAHKRVPNGVVSPGFT